MKILITGAAGMIGSNLAYRLHSLGFEIHLVDNLWRGSRENLLYFFNEEFLDKHFTVADLAEPDVANQASEGIEVIFHLADIVAGINWVFSHEYEVWSRNIMINSLTLQGAIKNKVRHYVYVGTACSYPKHLTSGKNASKRPLKESDAYPANPESAYGWSKLMGEYELELASSEGLITSTILRLHNVYGFPTETSIERSQVIPSLARKVANYPEEDFVVWGSGHQRRSFVFVDDVVDALVAAMTKGVNQGPIQIGPVESTPISEVAHMLSEFSDRRPVPKFDSTKPEGDGDRVANTEKSEDMLSWRAKTSLRVGLRATFDWVSKQAGGN